jgi:putative RNA 2'-phosphotransferase
MDEQRVVKVSKFLAKHLRHQPERLGLELQPGGWVGVDELLRACGEHGFALSRAELEEVVARNDKRRFAFDAAGDRIRASQGHSVDVDLGLDPVAPPDVLFHGTNERAAPAILRRGIDRRGRQHVHLSADPETARRVGSRRGRPVILIVEAARMAADGHAFFRSDNGVWLTGAVPAAYVRLPGASRARSGGG